MKIKFLSYIIFFSLFFICHQIKADVIFFDSKSIEIEDEGNIIYSGKGIAKIPNQKLIIKSDNAIYNKLISQLLIKDNVEFFDDLNQIIINSKEAIYDEINNTIISKGETYIKIEDKYEIFSEDILYDRNSMTIISDLDTKIYDDLNNLYNFKDGFLFDKIKEVIASKSTNIIDNDNNNYLFDNVKINLKTKELVGKEVRIDFINDFFGDENNDPLLKGKSAVSDNEETVIQKAVFSTCNTNNKNCRGWEIQTDEFKHNKIDKLFEYKNSWLKVFNQRVFFLPYFNHPDPSIKRKSGFLTPVYSSSDNLGRSINIPYFYVLSENKDMTLNPRIYSENDNFILQSEYRQAFENSDLIADLSFNYNDKNTSTHSIVELTGNFDEDTYYALEFENVSGNDNYLKIHDFKNIQDTNSLMKKINTSSLTSFFKINKDIDEETRVSSSVRIYEDLTVTNTNDKYQYVFPDFSFNKDIDLEENYNGTLFFNTSGYQKLHSTNIYEAQLNNDFNFKSFDYINLGIVSNYNFLLKNYNTYAENSTVFDDNNDHDLFGTVLLNSELPLKKISNDNTNFLKPKVQIKFSPTNGKNISSTGTRLSYDRLFSSNRIGRSDMVEEGKSLTLGLEYEKLNFTNEKLIGFNIGNILKDKKNSSMPSKSKLDQTRSDIIGNFVYNPNSIVKLEYDFSYERDFSFSNYDAISAEFGDNKLITSFDYITENHELGDSETIKNNTLINFTDEHSLQFETTKDLKSDFTEVINFNYGYNTDCLSISLNYNKRFFRDGNLVPDESLNFLIKFIPFAELRGSASSVVKNKENK